MLLRTNAAASESQDVPSPLGRSPPSALHLTNQPMIHSGPAERSVQRRAWVPDSTSWARESRSTAGARRASPCCTRPSSRRLSRWCAPFAVAVGDRDGPPAGSRILCHDREVRQALALQARPSRPTGAAQRSRLLQGGIQPPPPAGDEKTTGLSNLRQRLRSLREA